MKIFKSEKGAITIIVLASVLLFTIFLGSTYMIISNKIRSQKEIIEETKKIYNENAEETYNSFFNKDIIPIYENNQYLNIGKEQNIQVNDKYYNFSKSNMYRLMNDLTFYAGELSPEEMERIPADWWITKKGRIDYNRTYSKSYIFR